MYSFLPVLVLSDGEITSHCDGFGERGGRVYG